MKKRFLIFLSILHLVLSTGFTQYAHLCKGMAVNTYSLTDGGQQNSDKPCPICSAKEKKLKGKKKDCCKHESKIAKVDDGVKKHSNFHFLVKVWDNAIPNKMLGIAFDFAFFNAAILPLYLTCQIPIRGNLLYILHCVYRI